MDSPDSIQESTNQPQQFPRLIWPIIFRFALAVLFGIPIIYFIAAGAYGDPLLVLMILTVLVGVPSLIIAVGLLRRKRRAATFAVAYDVIIGSALLAFAISATVKAFVTPAFATLGMLFRGFYDIALFPQDHYVPNSLSDILMFPSFGVFGLALLVEGAHLLRRMKVTRRSCTIWGCCVAAILVSSLGPKWLQARRFDPVVTYVQAHWIEIPQSSRIRLDQQRGYADLDIDGPKDELISIFLSPSHLNGPWHFEGKRHPSHGEQDACLMAWQAHPPKTAEDALKLLRAVGVTDPDLKPAGETKMYGSRRTFCFWSPRARGTYAVPVGDGRFYLFLRESVDIP